MIADDDTERKTMEIPTTTDCREVRRRLLLKTLEVVREERLFISYFEIS